MKRAFVVALTLLLLAGVCWALNCPKCGKPLQDGAKFCGHCGLSLTKVTGKCGKCGATIHFPATFCGKCGTKIIWPKQGGGGGPVGPGPAPGPTPGGGDLRGTPLESGDVYARSAPSVMRIVVKNKAGMPIGSGSGFFVTADGTLVTNFHVIKDAWSADAVDKDGKKYRVLGYTVADSTHDLAVLKVHGKDFPALKVASGGLPRIGAKVVAIGYPLGRPTCTLSEGIVSAHTDFAMRGAAKQKLIQTTAAISHGSSGGPLLTGYGGILVQGVTTGTFTQGQAMNLVVPASQIRKILGDQGAIRRLPPPRPKIPIPEAPTAPDIIHKPKFTDHFDEEVRKGIAKGQDYLWSTQKDDGSWKPAGVTMIVGGGGQVEKTFPVGTTALMAYALLESGVSPQDPRMQKTLQWLKRQDCNKTYSLGLRANAWLAACKFRDTDVAKEYRTLLAADVKTLIHMTRNGSYTYENVCQDSMGDNSNAQYGLLGVWAGVQAEKAEIEVPAKYWEVVARHWKKSQNPDGGWGYAPHNRAKSYPSMTVAGLASMFVCVDNLIGNDFSKCGRNATIPGVDKALVYLTDVVKKIGMDSRLEGMGGRVQRIPLDMYYLFGVERVGLASGYKYLGGIDWYQVGATRILRRQAPSGQVYAGGWGDANVGTAYALLFLARGRNPVIFNKLEFPGDWNNRPRDLAMLSRWLSKEFERTVGWQIIQLANPVERWHDAPILYLSGSKDPGLTDEHVAKLRTFVQQGGTLLTVTECGGAGFKTGIRKAYAAMFPDYKLTRMPPAHEMFSVHFKVRAVSFYIIHNGVRPLAIHCDFDLPLSWQQRRSRTRKWTFQVAANVAMYVTGKGAFRPRGITHWPADTKTPAAMTVKLAKLKHAGNCDPEPLAHERLRRLLAQRNKIKLDVVGPLPISDLAASGAKVATLTGTGKLTLSASEQKALKDFVDVGGTLVIDAAGGDDAFALSARTMLSALFGPRLRTLASSAPLYQQKGMEITRVRYRGDAVKRLGGSHMPALRAVILKDRPAVIYSREDITGALVGFESATCSGYDGDSAFEIMRNIIHLAGKS